MSMAILSRYIRRQIFSSTFLVILIVFAIESFLELVIQFTDIGVGHYNIAKALIYVPMQLPALLYQLFPMIGFLGCLLGLSRLAGNSELIVMRSAGISINQIAACVIKTAIIMMIFVTIAGEWISPWLQDKSENMKQAAMGHANSLQTINSTWLHQDNLFVNIKTVVSPTQIQDITIYQFGANAQLQKATHAESGTFLNNNYWRLNNLAITSLQPQSVQTSKKDHEDLKLIFNPELMYEAQVDGDQQSIKDLIRTIFYRKKAGLMTYEFVFDFWQRLIQPITTIVMICLGIPFVFGSLRKTGIGSQILMGVFIGFAFYMLNQFFGPISLVYQFPPVLAAASPTLLFMALYIGMMARIRMRG